MLSSRILVVALLAIAASVLVPAAAAASPAAGHRPKNLAKPRITGTVTAGHTLETSRGTWSRGAARRPTRFTYAWLSCRADGSHCRGIRGAHARRFQLRAEDAGHRLRVRVTALHRLGPAGSHRYARTSARSRATKLIRSAPTTGGGGTGAPAPGSGGGPAPGGGGTPGTGLHVSGNKLLDGTGKAVFLHGINYAGTEFACIQGWGIFDGPSDDASVAAMRGWNANVVHIGLNEDCILGINGVKAAYSGANYMNAIVAYVNRLHAHGMFAEVSLMWAAPGTQQATDHPAILDADHAPDALKAIANAFKGDPDTFIGLQSEPHDIDWPCWRDGTSCGVGYTALGMQGALDAVRSTGATNVVTASGIDYSNNLTGWLSHKPTDALGQLMAEAHVYGGNVCDTAACLNTQMGPVAAQVPLIFGETGETYDGGACSSTSHIAAFLNWQDAHGAGYEAWQWNAWGNCLDLTSGPDGTVAGNDYAHYVHDHFATLN